MLSSKMHKDFKAWNNKKEIIHYHERKVPYFSEGEIWWCNFGINVGVEIDGKHEEFLRPAVILRKFNKDMVLVVPITGTEHNNKYYLNLTCEQGKSYKTCFSQIRTISSKRLFRMISKLDKNNANLLVKKIIEMIQGLLINNEAPH